jgi:hypothetical protein
MILIYQFATDVIGPLYLSDQTPFSFQLMRYWNECINGLIFVLNA